MEIEMLAVNMVLVGEGIRTMTYVILEREIESWEERLYIMEDNLLDLEEIKLNGNTPSNVEFKNVNMKERMRNLEDKIANFKKMREELRK